jgi:hypothetical protein
VLSRLDAPLPTVLVPRFAFAAAAFAVLVFVVVGIWRGRPDNTTGMPAPIAREAQASAPPAVSPPSALPQQVPSVAPASPPEPAPRPLRRFKPIEMPPVANVFGPPTDRITSATIADVPDAATESRPVGALFPPADPPPAIGLSPLTIAPLDLPPLRVTPLPSRK